MQVEKVYFINEEETIQKVRYWRSYLPFVGGKKLYAMIGRKFMNMGRDRFFDVLRSGNLLIKRKRKYACTTNSFHHFKRYTNLIKNVEIKKANEVYVSDITYIRTDKGFIYLSLVTDSYSRKIVGYDLSDSLSVEGALRAIKMALKKVKKKDELIHHSDRGIQYCCHAYTNLLQKQKVKISMGETGNCYDNALAERVNGILKQEFMLDHCFKDIQQAAKAVKQAVDNYNNIRPHWSLKLKTPNEVHQNAA